MLGQLCDSQHRVARTVPTLVASLSYLMYGLTQRLREVDGQPTYIWGSLKVDALGGPESIASSLPMWLLLKKSTSHVA